MRDAFCSGLPTRIRSSAHGVASYTDISHLGRASSRSRLAIATIVTTRPHPRVLRAVNFSPFFPRPPRFLGSRGWNHAPTSYLGQLHPSPPARSPHAAVIVSPHLRPPHGCPGDFAGLGRVAPPKIRRIDASCLVVQLCSNYPVYSNFWLAGQAYFVACVRAAAGC
jgi:hypothetical protein